MSMYSETKPMKKKDPYERADSDYSSEFAKVPSDSSNYDSDKGADNNEKDLFSIDIDAV